MMQESDVSKWHPDTVAIHAGNGENFFGEVSVPIFQTSTFRFRDAQQGAALFRGEASGYIYTRLANPTIQALESTLATLEKGSAAFCTASGMAAVTTVLLALLEQGSHLVGTDGMYGPSRVVVERHFRRFGVESQFVDTTDVEQVEKAMQKNTRVILVETPANPTMKLTDVEAVAQVAHRHGAYLVVDNTFASPYLQQPLTLGADVVVHSLTKYLNGHSDVVAGAIVVNNGDLAQLIKPVLNAFGGVIDPHQAWLVQRGIRTLPLRVQKAEENAHRLAEFLAQHPAVLWVNYPGLPSHPQHQLARRQMKGFGAMISFGVKGGLEGCQKVLNAVRLITLAVSLGGVETLIEHPATMTHASMLPEERHAAGIPDEMIRLSVGCEAFEDLRDDLNQALNQLLP